MFRGAVDGRYICVGGSTPLRSAKLEIIMTKYQQELFDKSLPEGDKPYIIERRYIGPQHPGMPFYEELRKWFSRLQFKTEENRDEAFSIILDKQQAGIFNPDRWEYRIAPFPKLKMP